MQIDGKKLDLHIGSWIPYKGIKTHMMQFVLFEGTIRNGCTIVVKAIEVVNFQ